MFYIVNTVAVDDLGDPMSQSCSYYDIDLVLRNTPVWTHEWSYFLAYKILHMLVDMLRDNAIWFQSGPIFVYSTPATHFPVFQGIYDTYM